MMPIAAIKHIEVDEKGVARIAGSRIKVIHLVMNRTAEGGSVEDVQARFPHLSLAQVFAAFAYYFDHKDQLDAEIAESIRLADEYCANAGESELVKKLRALRQGS
ncbi:MAG TPA: DUF433 domain-containing protein [Gemmataceae bacterium]|nr:DUF433 domain-containing protein [Gemmataceae bacterium]